MTQPEPRKNKNPIIQELVMQDMQGRLDLGIERYGTGLQAHNGRDMLVDAYEEALDLCVYLRGALYERDSMSKCVDCGEEAVTKIDDLKFCAECADEYEEDN